MCAQTVFVVTATNSCVRVACPLLKLCTGCAANTLDCRAGLSAAAAAFQPAQLQRRAKLSRFGSGKLHEAVSSLHHAAAAGALGSSSQAAHTGGRPDHSEP